MRRSQGPTRGPAENPPDGHRTSTGHEFVVVLAAGGAHRPLAFDRRGVGALLPGPRARDDARWAAGLR
eukprot:198616-Heterocapsa_arctica.AAC.1